MKNVFSHKTSYSEGNQLTVVTEDFSSCSTERSTSQKHPQSGKPTALANQDSRSPCLFRMVMLPVRSQKLVSALVWLKCSPDCEEVLNNGQDKARCWGTLENFRADTGKDRTRRWHYAQHASRAGVGQGCLRKDIPLCRRSSRYGGKGPLPTRGRGPGNSQGGGELERGLCV